MSKFDKLFEARGVKTGSKKSTSKKGARGITGAVDGEKLIEETPAAERSVPVGVKKRRGRPHGKRTDPNYVGFTTYIRKETHRNVKRALFDDPDERELSELVEDLLRDWLKTKAE